jgi:hypothetical protein
MLLNYLFSIGILLYFMDNTFRKSKLKKKKTDKKKISWFNFLFSLNLN